MTFSNLFTTPIFISKTTKCSGKKVNELMSFGDFFLEKKPKLNPKITRVFIINLDITDITVQTTGVEQILKMKSC